MRSPLDAQLRFAADAALAVARPAQLKTGTLDGLRARRHLIKWWRLWRWFTEPLHAKMPTPFDVPNVAATDGSRPQRRSSAARRTLVALVPVWLFSLAAGGCTRSAGTSPSSSAGRGAPPPLPSGGNRAAEPSPLA